MIKRPQENRSKFQNILIMIFIGIGFGLTYNTLFYPHNLAEYLEAVTISIFIGITLGIAEEFLFKTLFQRLTVYKVLLIRTLLYSLFVSIILSLVLSIEVAFEENVPYIEALILYFKSPMFRRDFFFSLAFVFMIIFFVQIIQLIGLNNLGRLFTGQFHKPREVKRIFMFMDLNDSTSLAENLGNEQYSAFLSEYLNDLCISIIRYKGEVYQFVGDEVSVMWPVGAYNNGFLQCFFKAGEIIDQKKAQYIEKYGSAPEFKAGAHVGTVVGTEVGSLKKELVYHGDVVNTTSRIIGKCKELNQSLLISDELLSIIASDNFEVIEKGEMELRGKSEKIKLYGVKETTSL